MTDKKKLQEKYVELQLLSMQIKQVEEQLNVLDQKTLELINLRDSLQNLQKIKVNTKSLVPIGLGVFVPGTVDATKGVLVNVGAGVVVKKTTDEAQEIISTQLRQLEDVTLELNNNLRVLAEQAQHAEEEIDNLAG